MKEASNKGPLIVWFHLHEMDRLGKHREFNRKIYDMEGKMDNPGEPCPNFHFV